MKKKVKKNGYFKFYVKTIILLVCMLTLQLQPLYSSEIVDRIVVVVNDDIITLSDLNEIFDQYYQKITQSGYLPAKEKEMIYKVRQDAINRLIDNKLTEQEIEKKKIFVDDKELNSAIERIKKDNYYTDEDLRAALLREGLTVDEYKGHIEKQILRSKLVNYEIKSKIVITGEDVKDYYNKNKKLYKGKIKYHLKNIIIPLSEYAAEDDRKKAENSIKSILSLLNKGDSFADVAKKYSRSALASQGGDLGFIEESGLSVKLQQVIKNIKVGEFTGIIETDHGYQIFFVEDIVTTKGKSLEIAYADIENKLYNEVVNKKYSNWLEKLRGKSVIKIIN